MATKKNAKQATRNGSDRPNILVIWGDDIGTWNVGAYTHGMIWEAQKPGAKPRALTTPKFRQRY